MKQTYAVTNIQRETTVNIYKYQAIAIANEPKKTFGYLIMGEKPYYEIN